MNDLNQWEHELDGGTEHCDGRCMCRCIDCRPDDDDDDGDPPLFVLRNADGTVT